MTLGLATRGYLCQGGGTGGPFGLGPDIVGSADMTPEVRGAKSLRAEAPKIMGGSRLAPTGAGTLTAPTTAVDGPEIVGGGEVAPTITGADEDD